MAQPQNNIDDAERRVAPRMRVLKRAKIIFNHGFSTFDSVVRNISATGALLTMDEAVHLPKEFMISIGEEPERPAKLIYRRSMFAGIRFLDALSEASDRSSERDRLGGSHADPRALIAKVEASSLAAAPTEHSIKRIASEPLPIALVRNFPWPKKA